jgi:hypothetical protein
MSGDVCTEDSQIANRFIACCHTLEASWSLQCQTCDAVSSSPHHHLFMNLPTPHMPELCLATNIDLDLLIDIMAPSNAYQSTNWMVCTDIWNLSHQYCQKSGAWIRVCIFFIFLEDLWLKILTWWWWWWCNLPIYWLYYFFMLPAKLLLVFFLHFLA